ncbi:MAG TPA: hypothetical protein PLP33_14850 [Leptospiraceae bacterium]|nr:hypothetical protein [Leptospiraceae bacterium]
MDLNTIVIDRSFWERGKGLGQSFLVSEENNLCVFGFYCIQRGIPENYLVGNVEPNDLIDRVNIEPIINLFDKIQLDQEDYEESFAWTQKEIVYDIIKLNDLPVKESCTLSNKSLLPGNFLLESEEQREEILILHFAKIGENIEFVN